MCSLFMKIWPNLWRYVQKNAKFDNSKHISWYTINNREIIENVLKFLYQSSNKFSPDLKIKFFECITRKYKSFYKKNKFTGGFFNVLFGKNHNLGHFLPYTFYSKCDDNLAFPESGDLYHTLNFSSLILLNFPQTWKWRLRVTFEEKNIMEEKNKNPRGAFLAFILLKITFSQIVFCLL